MLCYIIEKQSNKCKAETKTQTWIKGDATPTGATM